MKQKLSSLKNFKECLSVFLKDKKFPFILLSFIFFVFYLMTGPKNIVSFADSLEMVTSSYFLTPAHPPGFSLYVIVTKLLTSCLFFVKDIYQRYVLVTHLYSSLTIFFVSYGVSKISKDIKTGVLAAIGFALIREFWIYSLLPEVFSLNNLLVAMMFFYVVKFLEEKNEMGMVVAFFLIGLSLNNHWTACLMAAPVGLVMLLGRARFSVYVKSFFAMILGGAFIVTMFYLTKHAGSALFPHENTWSNIWEIASRKRYGGAGSSGSGIVYNYDSLLFLLKAQIHQYSYFLIPFFFIGAGVLIRKKVSYIFVLLAYVITGPLFVYYMNIKGDSLTSYGMMERFHILSYLFTGILIAFGVTFVFTRLKIRNSLYALAIFAIALQLLKVNFYGSIRRDDNITRSFVDMTLDNIPDKSVILTFNDAETFALNYEIMIAQKNRNILLLNTRGFQTLMKNFNHLSDHLKERNLKLDLNFRDVDSVEAFIARNSERVPIFILLHAIKPEHGLDKGKINVYPVNSLAFRISRKPIVIEPNFASKIYNPLIQQFVGSENHFNEQMNKIYIGTLARIILEYKEIGKIEWSDKIYHMTKKIYPNIDLELLLHKEGSSKRALDVDALRGGVN